jgi:hypothetical protein
MFTVCFAGPLVCEVCIFTVRFAGPLMFGARLEFHSDCPVFGVAVLFV